MTASDYHHGDLRATLLRIAMRTLEEAAPFSLRAVAREAGVSPTAPYRHFADRAALESALATEGFRELKAVLGTAGGRGASKPATPAELADVGVAYVGFARRRPALFRLMFGQPCDTSSEERVRATEELRELMKARLERVFPEAGDTLDALAMATWGLVHGLAFLYLDGKLTAPNEEAVDASVRAAMIAIMAVRRAPTATRR